MTAEPPTLQTHTEHVLARVLADAPGLREAGPQVLELVCDELGWDYGELWVVDEPTSTLRREAGWARPRHELIELGEWTALEPGERLAGRVWAEGRVLQESLPSSRSGQALGIPLISKGRIVGVLEIGCTSDAAPAPDREGLARLGGLGAQITQLLLRDAAERELQDLKAWSGVLANANDALGASLDIAATLERVAQLPLPAFADWSLVEFRPHGGGPLVSAGAHADPDQQYLVDALRAASPGGAGIGTGAVAEHGRPELYTHITDPDLLEASETEEHLSILRGLRPRSAICTPLIARGRTLGVMTVVSSGAAYTEQDLRKAQDLVHLAGLAVDNARLYEERAHTARILQQSVLPPELPDIPGVDLVARYHPADEAVGVGGDFYDVFRTNEHTWSIVIGDVCGKGAEAAALTSLSRFALRAAAVQEQKPSGVLKVLNETILHHGDEEHICSVIMARVDPIKSGVRVTLSCAGHPLPFLIETGAAPRRAGRPGTILGAVTRPGLRDEAIDLVPGDTLVLCTDGVLEARGTDRALGEDGVTELLTAFGGEDAQSLASRIERTALDMQQGRPRDDIAVLVLRVTAGALGRTTPRRATR